MPELNGYDATEQIREKQNGHRPIIIALTAGAMKGERERCLQCGMDDFMTKPVILEQLESILDKWLLADDEYTSVPTNHTPITQTSLPVFDRVKLLNKLGGSEESIQQILTLVTQGAMIELVESLEKTVNNSGQDLTALKSAVHSIKGAASGVCFEQLAGVSHELEQINAWQTDEVEAKVSTIRQKAEEAITLVKKSLK